MAGATLAETVNGYVSEFTPTVLCNSGSDDHLATCLACAEPKVLGLVGKTSFHPSKRVGFDALGNAMGIKSCRVIDQRSESPDQRGRDQQRSNESPN